MKFIWQNFGWQAHQVEECQKTDPEFVVPPNVLEPCGEETRLALESLMNSGNAAAGSGRRTYTVLAVARNVNPVLRERYERARTQLLEASQGIKPHRAATAEEVKKKPNVYSVLGDFEPAINEYPLWHGTPSTDGVKGIFKTGFDIAYAGATGTAYSPGFYFADQAATSDGYVRSGNRVNAKYTNVRCILLCRANCGNLREVSRPPSEEEKMRLTAECLGPGGTFGPRSSFHSVLGGGWAYVCMHRDQIYPEYVAVYQHGDHRG